MAHATLVIAIAEMDAFVTGAVQEEVALLLGQLAPRLGAIDRELLGDGVDRLFQKAEGQPRVREQCSHVDGDTLVGHYQARVDLARRAQAVTRGAGAVRTVEAEHAWLDLGQRDAAIRAGELLREGERETVDEFDLDQTLGEGDGSLDGVGEPPSQALLHHQPVDDHGDVVLVLLVEHDILVELAYLTVDLDA